MAFAGLKKQINKANQVKLSHDSLQVYSVVGVVPCMCATSNGSAVIIINIIVWSRIARRYMAHVRRSRHSHLTSLLFIFKQSLCCFGIASECARCEMCQSVKLKCYSKSKYILTISCASSNSQYVTEKMGGAEGTKLDLDFMDMERKTDVTNELVEEIQVKTKEFLQPNPTARAKMAAVKGISKLSGQAKSNTYPQPEGLLADCMLMYGKKLGDNSIFGKPATPSIPLAISIGFAVMVSINGLSRHFFDV